MTGSTAARPVLLIAAHGERGGARDNARLAALAEAVAGRVGDACTVTCGVLSGAPSIDDALRPAMSAPVLVAPLFMSDGYFVSKALPARLAKADVSWRMLTPLGLTDGFFDLAAAMVARVGEGRAVLVLAHGSATGPRPRQCTERFAAELAARLDGPEPACAYLEEPPFARDAVASAAPGTVIVSLFAGDGLHAGDDVPGILTQTGRRDLEVVTPAAHIDAVAAIIADQAGAALNNADASAR